MGPFPLQLGLDMAVSEPLGEWVGPAPPLGKGAELPPPKWCFCDMYNNS
jgi:hypothetical protein